MHRRRADVGDATSEKKGEDGKGGAAFTKVVPELVVIVIVIVVQSVHPVPQIHVAFVDPVGHDAVGKEAHAVCCPHEQHPLLRKTLGSHRTHEGVT